MKSPVFSRLSWVCPVVRSYKVNSDASMLWGNLVGVGLVIHDAQGRVVLRAVHRYEARWSVALAAKFGVVLAQQYGCTHVEL